MADVTLPQLGETVTEGTITQWFKSVGDTVAEDEPLFEVSTDKVDTEVPSPVSGTLTEIRVEEGDTVEVGTVIAVVGDGDAAPADDSSSPKADTEAAPESEPAPEPAADTTQDTTQDEEVTGPAPDAAPQPEQSAPVEAKNEEYNKNETTEPAPPAEPKQTAAKAGDNRLLSPVVRRLVNDHDLDVDQIEGSGPGGRITRDDVLDHIDATGAKPQESSLPSPSSAPQSAPAPAPATASQGAPEQSSAPQQSAPQQQPSPQQQPAPAARPAASAPSVSAGERDEVVKLSKIRQLTGDHMVMSKATSPHAFSVVEVDFANVDVTRGERKSEWKSDHGFSLTYLPFIARAVIDALGEFPHLNASVSGNELIVHDYIDLGIAVDLDYEGLLAPVVRDADTKRLGAIASEIHDLADRARNRKLAPDEISGGTFTLSNNGSAGSVLTMPIINQPQVAIISTDAIVRKPVVVGQGGLEAIAIHPMGNLAMSWDHRAFDGAYAAGFLKKVKEILETKDWGTEF